MAYAPIDVPKEPKMSAAMEAFQKLDKDLKNAAKYLGPQESRYLVDLYYQSQEFRKASGNQLRAAREQKEPNAVLHWVADTHRRLEHNIKRALDIFTSEYYVGAWMKSIVGIGPVIAAGMMCHIDIRKAPTVGHIWRFAGYDPGREWLGKKKAEELVSSVCGTAKIVSQEHLEECCKRVNVRWENVVQQIGQNPVPRKDLQSWMARCPWNANFKCLCYKLGDCFVKHSGREGQYYGSIYHNRKEYELAKNEKGDYAPLAKKSLAEKNFGKDTEARKWYEQGKLPPARIHMRCLRYTHKMFLSHLHHVMYQDFYGKEPPKPFAIETMPNHSHFVPLPNWPFKAPGTRSLRDLYKQEA